ncbi:MAG: LytTR family DNA-binding domain-containing protein [Gemmatimonadota bacterium]
MPITCIIVEDEPLAVERLVGYIVQLPFLGLVGTFDDALAALAFLTANPVDLVFLDISLGGLSGIELLETSAITSRVILTTAHPEHALKAYDLKVADYLLKPFTFQRFVQAVDQVQSGPAQARAQPASDRKLLFVKTEFRLEKVLLSDVLYIEGKRDYRQIHTTSKRIMTLETFGELEQRIAPDLVCRVHKSYMVALDKIESIERDRIKIRDQLIPISETYRAKFYALIDHRTK